ncbi:MULTISPECIES: hypothetical protein [unclassified Mesorhizobium]|uniref:hypothetical protein n=1 Tax=unclassified Mesorhizobium TaxID=325217 RepID=UPI003339E96C
MAKPDKGDRTQRRAGNSGPTQRLEPLRPNMRSQNGWAVSNFVVQALKNEPITISGS